jgi:ferrous iron transport protein A
MGVDKRDLINALNTSVKELQQGIDLHCCLVSSMRQTRWRGSGKSPALMTNKTPVDLGNFPLRLAQEGDWVRIVAVTGGRGIHERLAGFGLRLGAEVRVLQNPMNGKLLLAHEGARLYLGGGMAHKIQVAAIQGGNR